MIFPYFYLTIHKVHTRNSCWSSFARPLNKKKPQNKFLLHTNPSQGLQDLHFRILWLQDLICVRKSLSFLLLNKAGLTNLYNYVMYFILFISTCWQLRIEQRSGGSSRMNQHLFHISSFKGKKQMAPSPQLSVSKRRDLINNKQHFLFSLSERKIETGTYGLNWLM